MSILRLTDREVRERKRFGYAIDRKYVLHVVPVSEKNAICGHEMGFPKTTDEKPMPTDYTVACYLCSKMLKRVYELEALPENLTDLA